MCGMKINIKVKPGAKNAAVQKSGDGLSVWVDAPATEGRANKRLVEILAEHFKMAKSQITITRGLKSKNKVVEIKVEKKLFEN